MEKFRTIVADPPWHFRRGSGRDWNAVPYQTMSLDQICSMGPQVLENAAEGSHLYLWVPTAMMPWGYQVMASWGFSQKSVYFWEKIRNDGGVYGGGLGFYFRNVVEPCLFGIHGKAPTRTNNEPNLLRSPRTPHSRKPDGFYEMVERQSHGPYLELFARERRRPGWKTWGDQAPDHGVILITTDPAAIGTWKQLIAEVFGDHQGELPLRDIYRTAEQSAKVMRAKALGHKWHSQIRRTLQEHFRPAGRGVWATA